MTGICLIYRKAAISTQSDRTCGRWGMSRLPGTGKLDALISKMYASRWQRLL
jgi:hypothetical protein